MRGPERAASSSASWQLGHKHAKSAGRIEAASDLGTVGLGEGGFWECMAGYEWYAGI